MYLKTNLQIGSHNQNAISNLDGRHCLIVIVIKNTLFLV